MAKQAESFNKAALYEVPERKIYACLQV